MRDLNSVFLTSKPQPTQGKAAVLGLGGTAGSILGGKPGAGRAAEPRQGRESCCIVLVIRMDTVMDALRVQSTLVKWALNTQNCHCHIGPWGST